MQRIHTDSKKLVLIRNVRVIRGLLTIQQQ